MKKYINFGWMEAVALILGIAVVALAGHWRVQSGDPQAVWFYCDLLGLCDEEGSSRR